MRKGGMPQACTTAAQGQLARSGHRLLHVFRSSGALAHTANNPLDAPLCCGAPFRKTCRRRMAR